MTEVIKVLFIGLLTVGICVNASAATLDKACRDSYTTVTRDEVKKQVRIELGSFENSSQIFKLKSSFREHEAVTVVFSSDRCTDNGDQLINCSGKPLSAVVRPYWTSFDQLVPVDMAYVSIQSVESRNIGADGNIYEFVAVNVGGSTTGVLDHKEGQAWTKTICRR